MLELVKLVMTFGGDVSRTTGVCVVNVLSREERGLAAASFDLTL